MSSSLLSRIATLEAEVKSLRAVAPLSVFMESLKAASAEEVKAWMDVCNEVSSKYLQSEVLAVASKKEKKAKEPKEPKEKKEKRAATNPTGPAEWNAFVRATWHEMAASAGVLYESDETFKKAAATAGVSYQNALQEAKKRKAGLEGVKVPKTVAKTSLEMVKAKVAAAKAAATPVVAKPVVAKPVVAEPVAEPVVAEPMAEPVADYSIQLELNWERIPVDGGEGWRDPTDNCVYDLAGEEVIGTYDEDSECFIAME
jgi:hypothetical protein